MHYKEYEVTPAASLYVHRIWSHESEADAPFTYYSTADAYCKIIVHYKGGFRTPGGEVSPRCALQATTKYASTYTTNQRIGIFGIALYPYALPSIFGEYADTISDKVLDLRQLGANGRVLSERLLLAENNTERTRIATRLVESHLQSLPPVARTIQSMLEAQGRSDINELAGESGLSRRQFERSFKHLAGFSPALYARIIRFQALVDHPTPQYEKLAQMAQNLGYYDQAHFINEFRMFSGHPPTRYLKKTTTLFSNT
jgi:AraC-like DNA-binding protein